MPCLNGRNGNDCKQYVARVDIGGLFSRPGGLYASQALERDGRWCLLKMDTFEPRTDNLLLTEFDFYSIAWTS